MTDDEMVLGIINRDENAFCDLLRKYGGLMKSVVRTSLSGFPAWFDDCVNEVFFAVWKNIGSYDNSKNSLKNWLCAVAKYKAIDYKRRFAAHIALPLDEADVEAGRDGTLEAEIRDEARELLKALSPEDRELFILRYIVGEEIGEISERTAKAPSQIYNRLSRGRKRLREIYRKWGEES